MTLSTSNSGLTLAVCHFLQVTISDQGDPPLSSTTRVVIKVMDENDNRPEFFQFFRRQQITVFATVYTGEDIFIYRVIAHDQDEGRNAEVIYSLKTPKDSQFRVDPVTGKIYSTQELKRGSFELLVSCPPDTPPSCWLKILVG